MFSLRKPETTKSSFIPNPKAVQVVSVQNLPSSDEGRWYPKGYLANASTDVLGYDVEVVYMGTPLTTLLLPLSGNDVRITIVDPERQRTLFTQDPITCEPILNPYFPLDSSLPELRNKRLLQVVLDILTAIREHAEKASKVYDESSRWRDIVKLFEFGAWPMPECTHIHERKLWIGWWTSREMLPLCRGSYKEYVSEVFTGL